MFETSNNNQQFFVINLVIAFNRNHVFVEKNHEVKNIIIVILK